VKAIPFLQTLISYIKELKLAAPIWGRHAHITEIVDWDSPKGNISQFIRMSQDHMCYNMSMISVKVRGISDLPAMAEIQCPDTRNVLGHLSLQQSLTKYLPRVAIQDGILSNVCSLPFFQDVLADKQMANATKKGKKKGHIAPEMCFQLGSTRSVQTVHGANDEKYMNVTKPGVNLGLATQA
jgi:hypothetical protein